MTGKLTDNELEHSIAEALKVQNGGFTQAGLTPDSDTVCKHTAKYIVALLNVGKERLIEK